MLSGSVCSLPCGRHSPDHGVAPDDIEAVCSAAMVHGLWMVAVWLRLTATTAVSGLSVLTGLRTCCFHCDLATFIGIDLAGLLGGTHGEHRRWVRVEWGGIWGGVFPLQPTKGSGERRELPQRGPGQSPGRKWILAYFEGHRTLIFVPIWQNPGGTICISVPRSKFWGGDLSPCLPRDLRLWLHWKYNFGAAICMWCCSNFVVGQ